MDLEALVNQYHNQLNKNDLAIVAYILENPKEWQTLNIVDLAKKCHTSKSSILRLTKKLGFTGFSEFKYSIKNIPKQPLVNKNLLDLQINDIEATLKLLKQSDVVNIIKKMHKAERIFGFGTGWGQRNALIELNRNFMSMGKYMQVIPAKKEFELSIPTITKKDFVIMISLSGNTRDLEQHIQILNLKEVPILSITAFKNNFLAQMTPYNIYYQTTMLQQGKSNEVVSFVTLNVICDALFREYIAYSEIEEKKY